MMPFKLQLSWILVLNGWNMIYLRTHSLATARVKPNEAPRVRYVDLTAIMLKTHARFHFLDMAIKESFTSVHSKLSGSTEHQDFCRQAGSPKMSHAEWCMNASILSAFQCISHSFLAIWAVANCSTSSRALEMAASFSSSASEGTSA